MSFEGLAPFWQAIIATVVISVIPTIILVPMVFGKCGGCKRHDGSMNPKILKILLGFAVGGLLGDAFLHIIPHAMMHGEGHGHSHGNVSHEHSHGHSSGNGFHEHEHEHSHGHSHALSPLFSDVGSYENEHEHGYEHGHGHEHDYGNEHEHGHGRDYGNVLRSAHHSNHSHGSSGVAISTMHALPHLGHARTAEHEHNHIEHTHHDVIADSTLEDKLEEKSTENRAKHDEHTHSMQVPLLILAGICLFFIIERVSGILGVGHSHSHGNHEDEDHSHHSKYQYGSNENAEAVNEEQAQVASTGTNNHEDNHEDHGIRRRHSARPLAKSSLTSLTSSTEDKGVEGDADGEVQMTELQTPCSPETTAKYAPLSPHSPDLVETREPSVSVVLARDIKPVVTSPTTGGMLAIIADLTHNFTDGLALGAAFQTSFALGISTSLAVLVHEVPHEIGDFAVLVKNGFSPLGAFGIQFVTAGAALLGVLANALAAELLGNVTQIVLPITAGGFIYIALVSAVPAILEESDFDTKEEEIVVPVESAENQTPVRKSSLELKAAENGHSCQEESSQQNLSDSSYSSLQTKIVTRKIKMSAKEQLIQLSFQVSAAATGIGLMVLIAQFE